jgi:ubiquinone/menaquinone biosynthesis C-methylase UbiE
MQHTGAYPVESPSAVSALERFYRLHAPIYDATRWIILRGRRAAVRSLGLRPGDRALEIGCGTGLNLELLREAVTATGHVTGVDVSAHMLARAERRCVKKGWRNVTLVRADASKLALSHQYDAVLFAYSITVIPDWRAALERAIGHLRTGGRLAALDFGLFEGWPPPTRWICRGWLKLHHVDTARPYGQAVLEAAGRGHVCSHVGGCYILAIATKAVA